MFSEDNMHSPKLQNVYAFDILLRGILYTKTLYIEEMLQTRVKIKDTMPLFKTNTT